MSSVTASDLDEIEDALKKLRVAYEKYFAGVERVEPLKERDGVKRTVQRLLGENSKNTARRFRLQTLNASLVTYEQYWNRVTRQIEEGTFKRDRVRADKILRAAGLEPRNPLAEVLAEIGPDMGPDLGDDLEVDDVDDLDVMPVDDDEPAAPAATAARPATPPANSAPTQPAANGAPKPRVTSTLAGVDEALAMAAQATTRSRPAATRPTPAQAAPRPASAPATARAEAKAAATTPSTVPPAPTTGYSASVRQLHESYVSARLGTGERDPVSLDAFAATLQKQAAAIKARFSCKEVEFKVALKDGKAILKATPR